MDWKVGDKVRIAVDWGRNDGAAVRVQGKRGTVAEILDRKHYPIVVDVNDGIVGRAAFEPHELKKED